MFVYRVLRRLILAIAFSFAIAIESADSSSYRALRVRPAISQAYNVPVYKRRRAMKDHRGWYVAGIQDSGIDHKLSYR